MKLSENAYNFAQRVLKLADAAKPKSKPVIPESSPTNTTDYVKENIRVVGGTDYKKYELLAKDADLEDIVEDKTTQEAFKMGCSNDLRKEKQLYEKPSIEKIEAAQIFKNEGDDLLKQKLFKEAANSYEKGLLQLFYTFSDNKEEDKIVDQMKMLLNMNLSMCKINLNLFDEAIGCCLESLRVDDKNLKALYRVAYCYFKKEKFEDAKNYIKQALEINKDSKEFIDLLDSITKREKEIESQSKKLFKKFIK